ncbi:MAG: hypothetical protein HY049_01690 [Acidobacteria bacterium]|nr:hypothetical protein [Acidobacteriota bacterium]
MKRGFRALAVLAAVAVVSAGPASFAACLDFGGFAIFQCADRAYFNPAPAGSGSVSAVFWQIGYGNGNTNDGSGSSGTGNGTGAIFNGNDNGVFGISLEDARTSIGSSVPPVGALCLRNNNWANTGVDGCCDNVKDPALPLSKDGILNPLYNVNYVRNYAYDANSVAAASRNWVQDSPMGTLLRESTGSYFAVAAVTTMIRTSQGDVRPGFYNFKDVTNGLTNPFNAAVHNIVPWQPVPGKKGTADPLGLVRDVSTPTVVGPHTLTLGWNDVTMYRDNRNLPSTNTGVPGGGMGTGDFGGDFIRYVVETQAIVDANNPISSLSPTGWTAAATYTNPTNSASQLVNADSCVRLHTYFGLPPGTSTQTVANCRLGICGDLGYDVTSPASCVGGPLVSESPIELKAIRERAGAVTITWKASAELSTKSYRIEAVGKKGNTVLGTVPATGTGSGTASSYKFSASVTQLKGTRTVIVVAEPSGASQSVQIQ